MFLTQPLAISPMKMKPSRSPKLSSFVYAPFCLTSETVQTTNCPSSGKVSSLIIFPPRSLEGFDDGASDQFCIASGRLYQSSSTYPTSDGGSGPLEDDHFIATVAARYIQEILVDGLGIACFIVGHDFRFGHNRRGDFSLLQKSGEEFGFEVIETAAYERNGQRISSSFIREQLAESNFELVEQLLGRPFSMTGEVVSGQHLGSELGFPTCNINPHRLNIPLHGVFACQVRLGDRFRPAAVNIGYRPTVTEDGDALLEAHILDFDEVLYGKNIEIIFRLKLREELKFDGLDALKQQISADVQQVREVFGAAL